MELLTLNVMTKMNVYPSMNLVKILKEVTAITTHGALGLVYM